LGPKKSGDSGRQGEISQKAPKNRTAASQTKSWWKKSQKIAVILREGFKKEIPKGRKHL